MLLLGFSRFEGKLLKTSVRNNSFHKQAAFTLAEVLITLGIIGVVAAMTLPTLIQSYQKQVTITSLKRFYSVMSQAFERAKADYGSYDSWDSSDFGNPRCPADEPDCDLSKSGNGELQLKWLQKYLLPYIKYTEADFDGKYSIVGLPDGSGFTNYNNHVFYCIKFKDCKAKLEDYNSRNRFIFLLPSGNYPFRTYGSSKNSRREQIVKGNYGHGCAKGIDMGNCSALLEYDGWQFKDDYPW